MATQADIRQRVRNKLYSMVPPLRPFVTTLNDTVTASAADVTITVTDGATWDVGDIAEIASGEQWFVTAVAGANLTVVRAHNGTTLGTGVAGNALLKNPRFSLQQIDNAIDDCLAALELEGVHAWGTGTVTLASGQYGYAPTETDILDIVAVYYEDSSYGQPVPLPFTYNSNLHTTAFTGGGLLRLFEWGDLVGTNAVYFTYKKKIDAVTDLMVRQEEVLILGATYRLLAETIVSDTMDPGKRTDRTVQPGQTGRDARWLETEYYMALHKEEALLKYEADRLPANFTTDRARRWRLR